MKKMMSVLLISIIIISGFNIEKINAIENTNLKNNKIIKSSIIQINSIADLVASFQTANDNDILNLTSSFVSDVSTMSTTISLSTLAGDNRNITIDGSNLDLLLPTTLTTQFITLAHNSSGKIVFQNMSIKNSKHRALSFSGSGNYKVENITFDSSNNNAIYNQSSGKAEIVNSQFLNGKATAFEDGINTAHSIDIINSYFEKNTGGYGGSAIRINANATALIDYSTFESNSSNANYHGGAISTIPDSRAINLTIQNSAFYGNSNVNQPGGAIGIYHLINGANDKITIKDSYFEKNVVTGTANTADGGAIGIKNNSDTYTANIEISGNTFLKNTANDNAGAILVEATNSGVTISNIFNNTFIQNEAMAAPSAGVGGAIQTYGAPSSTISHNTFYQNIVHQSGGGGAIGISGATFASSSSKVANNIFIDNKAPDATATKQNVALKTTVSANVSNNGNVGYDSGSVFIPSDPVRNSLVRVENIFVYFYSATDSIPDYASVGDAKPTILDSVGSTNKKYSQLAYIPSPRIDEMLRTNNSRILTGVLEDVRGYPRETLSADNPYYPNAGAVEIYWARFDPGIAQGGQFSSRFDVQAEGGIESLAYPGVFYKINNPPQIINGVPVFEQNLTFTRNTLIGPANYGFTGWVNNSFTPAEVKDVNTVYEARKQTYVAAWTLDIFHLDFALNGGSTLSGHENDFITQEITNGVDGNLGKVPNSIPVRTGYDFLGWFDNDDGTGSLWDFSTPINKDTTLYAMWQPSAIEKFTVKFEMNNKGVQIPSKIVEKGNKVSRPNDPKESGYTFEGWYIDNKFTSKYDFNNTVNSNITLYAKWKINIYVLSFNLNGASSKAINNQNVQFNALAKKPADPVRNSYIFRGWNTKIDGSGKTWSFTSSKMPANNVTLYAQWEKIKIPDSGNLDMYFVLSFLFVGLSLSTIVVKRKYNT